MQWMLGGFPVARLGPARRALAALALAALPVLLVFLAPTVASGADGGRVRIAGVEYIGDIPTLVAERRELFSRHGVDARTSFGHSGKENLALLRAGDTDFALMALTPLILDRLADPTPGRPDDPVILASLVHSGLLNQVVAAAASGLDEPADLEGRRVGLMRGTNAEVVWWLFAAYHGLDPRAATIVDRPTAELPDALVAGEVEAAVLWEPWTSRLRERLDGGLHEFAGSDAYIAKWVLVTRRSTAAGRAATCRRILAAYREAIDFIEAHPETSLRYFTETMGIGGDALQAGRVMPAYHLSLDWSLVAAAQQQAQWARRAGYRAATEATVLYDLFMPAPLRAALPDAVGIPGLPDSGGTAP